MRFILTILILQISITNGFTQTLKGRLTNPQDTAVVLHYSYDYLLKHTDTIRLNAKGEFSKKFRFSKMGLVKVQHPNSLIEVYLFPGHDLSFSADMKDIKAVNASLQFVGEDAHIQINHKIKSHPRLVALDWNYDLPAEQFLARINEWRKVHDSLRTVFLAISKKPLSANIRQFIETDSINTLYWTILAFRDYHAFVLKKETDEDSFFVANINPHIIFRETDNFLDAEMYRSYWSRYISMQWDRKRASADPATVTLKNFLSFRLEETKKQLPGRLKEIALARIVAEDFPRVFDEAPVADYPFFDSLMTHYGNQLSNPKVLAFGRKGSEFNKTIRIKTAKGQPAPEFVLTDSSGKKVRLADFKGKIIYLDVWASWCAPCIAELPKYRELTARFKDRDDIAFISASIDASYNDWVQKGLIKHNPPGLQLWSGASGSSSQFAVDYFIKFVPKYILIDREGRLLDYNAPTPSEEKVITSLEEALKL